MLTSLAVVIGVAMVSGTYVLTDTLDAGLKSIFAVAYANADAVARSSPSCRRGGCGRRQRADRRRERKGDLVRERPGLGLRVNSKGTLRFSPLKLVSGSWPVLPGQRSSRRGASRLNVLNALQYE